MDRLIVTRVNKIKWGQIGGRKASVKPDAKAIELVMNGREWMRLGS